MLSHANPLIDGNSNLANSKQVRNESQISNIAKKKGIEMDNKSCAFYKRKNPATNFAR